MFTMPSLSPEILERLSKVKAELTPIANPPKYEFTPTPYMETREERPTVVRPEPLKVAPKVDADGPIKPGTKMTTAQLERVLGIVQDGVPGWGPEDGELMADVICELIEYRKADEKKKAQVVAPSIAAPFWQNYAPSQQTATEAHQNFERQKALMERLRSMQQYQYRPRNKVYWENNVARDAETLYYPDGSVAHVLSGIDLMMNFKDLPKERKAIEAHYQRKWEMKNASAAYYHNPEDPIR